VGVEKEGIKHSIPGNAPFGVFTYTTTINSLLFDDILDEDSFRFVIEVCGRGIIIYQLLAHAVFC
jgi:hypothetical protein